MQKQFDAAAGDAIRANPLDPLETNGDAGVGARLSPDALETAILQAAAIVERNTHQFGVHFPDDTTVHARYPLRAAQRHLPAGSNVGWTTGFVPGMNWLAWELTEEVAFLHAAEAHISSFAQRIDQRIDIETHDLGFLYTLSSVAAWRLRQDATGKRIALSAADALMNRFLEPAGIVQAWGNLEDPHQRGRTIIDSLMNMPLLYWASKTTGETRYADAAQRHTAQLRDNIFRADGSTFHTYYWDMASGVPLRGVTAQGLADESCWARGQAWGIYGFALNFRYSTDPSFLEAAIRCADYLLAHLPADNVPFWDLEFTDGSSEERDSSAAAIAVCGLLEVAHWLEEGGRKQRYLDAADAILHSLITRYTPAADETSDALLLHGVYSKPEGKGVNEGNLWGDYFYLEALMRKRNPQWVLYW